MLIVFADFSGWDYHVQTVDSMPMGGSESAASYLARALAWLGHEVLFLSNLSKPGKYDGVSCVSWSVIDVQRLGSLKAHAFVCVREPGPGMWLRNSIGPRARLISWTGHAANQAGVQQFHEARCRDVFTAHAFVSQWQRDDFARVFGLDVQRSAVMRNAIAPAFENQFLAAKSILPEKSWPPVLAYTSTPFRGLNALLDAFPHIRAAVPGTRLQVFSSLKVYQVDPSKDEGEYGPLYQRCRETEGIEYIGSVAQPDLARALRRAAVLAYPNMFAETSCIAVMEAMASGCRIVTSDFAALPETTAGFASLIPVDEPQHYLRRFIDSVLTSLRDFEMRSPQLEQRLRAQVNEMNAKATWRVRAGEWVQWLQSLAIN